MSRKVIYTYSFRKKLVLSHLELGINISTLSNKYSIGINIISRWINRYKAHGDAGLCILNNKYSGKFKEKVLTVMERDNLALDYASYYFNIPTTTISRWQKLYSEKGLSILYEENL